MANIEKLNSGFFEHFFHPLSILRTEDLPREDLSVEDQAEAKKWAFIGLIFFIIGSPIAFYIKSYQLKQKKIQTIKDTGSDNTTSKTAGTAANILNSSGQQSQLIGQPGGLEVSPPGTQPTGGQQPPKPTGQQSQQQPGLEVPPPGTQPTSGQQPLKPTGQQSQPTGQPGPEVPPPGTQPTSGQQPPKSSESETPPKAQPTGGQQPTPEEPPATPGSPQKPLKQPHAPSPVNPTVPPTMSPHISPIQDLADNLDQYVEYNISVGALTFVPSVSLLRDNERIILNNNGKEQQFDIKQLIAYLNREDVRRGLPALDFDNPTDKWHHLVNEILLQLPQKNKEGSTEEALVNSLKNLKSSLEGLEIVSKKPQQTVPTPGVSPKPVAPSTKQTAQSSASSQPVAPSVPKPKDNQTPAISPKIVPVPKATQSHNRIASLQNSLSSYLQYDSDNKLFVLANQTQLTYQNGQVFLDSNGQKNQFSIRQIVEYLEDPLVQKQLPKKEKGNENNVTELWYSFLGEIAYKLPLKDKRSPDDIAIFALLEGAKNYLEFEAGISQEVNMVPIEAAAQNRTFNNGTIVQKENVAGLLNSLTKIDTTGFSDFNIDNSKYEIVLGKTPQGPRFCVLEKNSTKPVQILDLNEIQRYLLDDYYSLPPNLQVTTCEKFSVLINELDRLWKLASSDQSNYMLDLWREELISRKREANSEITASKQFLTDTKKVNNKTIDQAKGSTPPGFPSLPYEQLDSRGIELKAQKVFITYPVQYVEAFPDFVKKGYKNPSGGSYQNLQLLMQKEKPIENTSVVGVRGGGNCTLTAFTLGLLINTALAGGKSGINGILLSAFPEASERQSIENKLLKNLANKPSERDVAACVFKNFMDDLELNDRFSLAMRKILRDEYSKYLNANMPKDTNPLIKRVKEALPATQEHDANMDDQMWMQKYQAQVNIWLDKFVNPSGEDLSLPDYHSTYADAQILSKKFSSDFVFYSVSESLLRRYKREATHGHLVRNWVNEEPRTEQARMIKQVSPLGIRTNTPFDRAQKKEDMPLPQCGIFKFHNGVLKEDGTDVSKWSVRLLNRGKAHTDLLIDTTLFS